MEFQWVQLYIGLAAAAIGYVVRLFFDKKKELQGPVNLARRAVYKKFIDILVDDFKFQANSEMVVGQLSPGDPDYNSKIEELKIKRTELMVIMNDKMFDFFIDYMLYASPDVINAFGDYRQYVFQNLENPDNLDEKRHTENLAKLLYEMRDDLGLSNKNLGTHGEVVLRGIMLRYHQIFG